MDPKNKRLKLIAFSLVMGCLLTIPALWAQAKSTHFFSYMSRGFGLIFGLYFVLQGSGFIKSNRDPEAQALWVGKYGLLMQSIGWIMLILTALRFLTA